MFLFLITQGGDGIINFDEFINLIDGLESFAKNEQESRDAYNAFDFTEKGFIDSIDIMEALKYVLESKPPKVLEDVISFYRLVPSREIDFKEFQSMVMTFGESANKRAKWEKVEQITPEKKAKNFLYSP